MGRGRALRWTLGLGLCVTTPAQGQALPLTLAWEAPPECGSSTAVLDELARVARPRAGFRLEPLGARAQVARSEGGRYTLALATEHGGQRGQRNLSAQDCPTLVHTLTLVLALAFGPGVELASTDAAPPVSGPAGSGEPAAPALHTGPAKRADIAPAAPAAAPPGTPGAWLLFVGAGAALSMLPRTATSGTLGSEYSTGNASVQLRVTGWITRADALRSDLDTRFDGLAAVLAGCGHRTFSSVTGALCAGARAAAVRGRSFGDTMQGGATAPWYALSASAALTWPARERVRLRFEAGLAASLVRPRFVIEGLGEVHRLPWLVPELGLLLLVAP